MHVHILSRFLLDYPNAGRQTLHGDLTIITAELPVQCPRCAAAEAECDFRCRKLVYKIVCFLGKDSREGLLQLSRCIGKADEQDLKLPVPKRLSGISLEKPDSADGFGVGNIP